MHILKTEFSSLRFFTGQFLPQTVEQWECQSLLILLASSSFSSELATSSGAGRGGSRWRWWNLLLSFLQNMIPPYDREDDDSLVVFDVEVDLGVHLGDDRVDRVGRVGQQ